MCREYVFEKPHPYPILFLHALTVGSLFQQLTVGRLVAYFWGTTERWLKMMRDNRKRWDDKQVETAAAAAEVGAGAGSKED